MTVPLYTARRRRRRRRCARGAAAGGRRWWRCARRAGPGRDHAALVRALLAAGADAAAADAAGLHCAARGGALPRGGGCRVPRDGRGAAAEVLPAAAPPPLPPVQSGHVSSIPRVLSGTRRGPRARGEQRADAAGARARGRSGADPSGRERARRGGASALELAGAAALRQAELCGLGSEVRTRRVRLVRDAGRDVSD